jgi:CelD/BcsL family acetyltransferase involved in cellulose biosynthesis
VAEEPHLKRAGPLALEALAGFDFGSQEYRRLFARSGASAFQHPDWLGAFYARMMHDVEPLIVTGRVAGALRLVVPLIRRRFPDGSAGIEYAFQGVTDYACPVLDRASGLPSDHELPERFAALLAPFAYLSIRPVHSGHVDLWSPLFGSAPSALGFGSHAVGLAASGDDRPPGSRIAGLARKLRRLEEHGPVRLRRASADDVRQLLAAARDLRAGRFADDPLQTPHGFEFYVDVAERGACSGSGRTYSLTSRDDLVGVLFGLADGPAFRYLLLAADYGRFGRFSPGLILLEKVMADWAAGGGRLFDFTIGDETFKSRFGAARSDMFEYRLKS